jgi:3-hydroxyisobutyrate dehydrogenase-like beta-hydroxyacid dehydrogenase
VLRAIGPTIQQVGSEEQARVVKLAVNLVIGGLAELMSEALVLGESAGVSREALLDVMGSSAAGAPFVKYKTPQLLNDDYAATFTTALMKKDIDLILDAADDNGVDLPVARELKTLLRGAIEAGYGNDDFIALFLYLRGASSYRNQEVVG